MFEVLLASRPGRVLRPTWFTGSMVVHVLVIVAVLAVYQGPPGTSERAMADTTLLLLPRLTPPEVKEPEPPPPPPEQQQFRELVMKTDPPPKGFQTVLAPSDIPKTIPPVDLSQPALDPRDFTGRGQEGGVAWGVIGGTGIADPAAAAGDIAGAVYAATLDHPEFEPARLVRQPMPRFPRTMETIGVGGRVVVQFIIDTAGTVEGRSIEVIESTHRAFEASARESVAQAVFRPARMGPRPVRQLTRQPINFVVNQ